MSAAQERRLIRVPAPHLPQGEGWKSDAPDPKLLGDGYGLRLAAAEGGSLALRCRDGSLGRLTLPRGVAVDARLRVYLLDWRAGRVLRYDSSAKTDPKRPFTPLPVGSEPMPESERGDPRRFVGATSLAVGGDRLVVADGGSNRVLVFALDSWALCDVWHFDAIDPPLDVAVGGGIVYILTPDSLFRHQPGDAAPQRIARNDSDEPWSRMALDRDGRLYVLLGEGLRSYRTDLSPELPLLEGDAVADPAQVRDRFAFPAIYTVPDEAPDRPLFFLMPESLARPCGRVWPEPAPKLPIETNFTRLPKGGFVFDSRGRRVEESKIPPPRTPLFERSAEWVSARLDSKLYRCVWDAVELAFADLPRGCLAEIQTQTTNDEERRKPVGDWSDRSSLVGVARKPDADPAVSADFLVSSPPGQYLWVKVTFSGDGFATPILSSLTLTLPRSSYLEHLPAVYSEDEQGRLFLERFLGIFSARWDSLEDRVERLGDLLDPRAVPASHLDYLAGWLGQRFENGWSEAECRRLLQSLPGILFARRSHGEDRPGGSRRGTLAALREYLANVLPTLAGRPTPAVFPLVVEGYRERDYRRANVDVLQTEELAPSPSLWGPGLVNRFRLDDSSRLDESKLLPEGRPDLDAFAMHAHRIRVVAPAVLVPNADAEAALRRAVVQESPAHLACEVQLVPSRFALGSQSTLGIDTILGGLPKTYLADPDGDPAASSAPCGGRLGYDTVLWSRQPFEARGRLGGTRLGVESIRL